MASAPRTSWRGWHRDLEQFLQRRFPALPSTGDAPFKVSTSRWLTAPAGAGAGEQRRGLALGQVDRTFRVTWLPSTADLDIRANPHRPGAGGCVVDALLVDVVRSSLSAGLTASRFGTRTVVTSRSLTATSAALRW